MGDFRSLLPEGILVIVLVGLTLLSACISTNRENASEANLTAGDIANHYLLRSAAITDYQSELLEIRYGRAYGRANSTKRIRFDFQSPSSYRIAFVEPSTGDPGTFWVSNGTTTTYYNAYSRTYDNRTSPSHDYNWQGTIRSIISDRNFTVLDRAVTGGGPRYCIEVKRLSWSDSVSPYQGSRIRAWIEPSTGLAWNVSIYDDQHAGAVPGPTTPPGRPVLPQDPVGTGKPIVEIRYEWIRPNTGFPEGYFEFVPPPGSVPICFPDSVVLPGTDPSIPITEPFPGGVRDSLSESDSGRTIMAHTGEVIEITLPFAPSLGMRWFMTKEGSCLELINAGEIIHMIPGELEPSGDYRWRFRALTPGNETLNGVLSLGECDSGTYTPGFILFVNIVE